MKTAFISAALSLFLASCAASAVVGTVYAEEGCSAVKISPSEINDGDSIVIYSPQGNALVGNSSASNSRYLSSSEAAVSDAAEGQSMIGAVPDDAAVFTVSYDEEGHMLFKAPEGYLTSNDTGYTLSFSEGIQPCSVWEIREDSFLYNVNASYTNNGVTYTNYYLNIYNGMFGLYGKNANSNPGAFTFEFFKVSEGTLPPGGTEGYVLPVFETSDIHGHIIDTPDKTNLYRMAYIADKVNDARGEDRDTSKTLLLDTGDIYQGTPLSNLLGGAPVSHMFDMMHYDAVSIGNHEFDWGVETVVDADATMRDYSIDEEHYSNTIPIIMSNLYRNGEKVEFAKDYIILRKTAVDSEGNSITVRIGVIGYSDDYSSSIMRTQFHDRGFEIREDVSKLNDLARRLETNEGCDATVLVAHGEAESIAGSLGKSHIDLVLGGHTHYNAVGRTSDGVKYMQPAGLAQAFSRADLVFDKETHELRTVTNLRNVSLINSENKQSNIPENADELDQDIVAACDYRIEQLDDVMHTTLGHIEVSALRSEYIEGSGGRATTMGNWMTDLMRRAAQAEVAFVNRGGIRTEMKLPEGDDMRDIKVSDIYEIFPFNNKVYRYNITLGEFLEVLKYSLNSQGETLLSQMSGRVDCYYTGREVDTIILNGLPVYVNGVWHDDWKDNKIVVAANEFIATSNRNSAGMDNPFVAWNDTDRLLDSAMHDSEAAFIEIAEEAEENDGLFYIQTTSNYINSVYVPASAQYEQFGDTIKTQTGDAFNDTASVWAVTVTPGTFAAETLNVLVNRHWSNDSDLYLPAVTGGSIVIGVVVNHAADEITSVTAMVNGLETPAVRKR